MFSFGLPFTLKRFPIRHQMKTSSYEPTIPFALFRFNTKTRSQANVHSNLGVSNSFWPSNRVKYDVMQAVYIDGV